MSSLASLAEEVVSRLAWTSVQASLLVTALWAVCRLVPRLSAATRSLLWWLLGVQLLLGLIVPTPVSLPLLSPVSTQGQITVPATRDVATFVPPSEHRINGFNQPGVASPTAVADTSLHDT